ncbi:hypothetical protein [Priestia megaterium]|uniref:hypothetical protein n=1 Tax=Priestia megaterium TaxID=1404 RepID=UPI001CDD8582|nr:hypothetical protein [Priestia megaterium]MCA4157730.1 hypothetical protein [Priestia megaterium]
MPINSTMVISILGSLGVASIAQVISHGLAQKREDDKYNKECLQNLYSPIIFRIRDYINSEAYRESVFMTEYFDTEDFKNDPQNPDFLFKKIMEHLEANLKYSSAEMIMKYEEVKIILELYNDEREDRTIILKPTLDLCSECLIEFVRISKELNILSDKIKNEITPGLLFSQFYLLLLDYELYSLTDEAPKLINFLNTSDLFKQDNWLNKCMNIRKKINDAKEEFKDKDYIDQDHKGDVFKEAYNFIFQIIKEFSSREPVVAESWSIKLNDDWNLRGKMLG